MGDSCAWLPWPPQVEARKAGANELLSAGKISQAEADHMTNNMAQNVKTMVERTNVGRPAFAGQSPMAGTGRAAGTAKPDKVDGQRPETQWKTRHE